MLEFKPDFEKAMRRMDAFWERSVFDRPVTQFYLEKPSEQHIPLPAAQHANAAERWLDVDYQAHLTLAQLSNRLFLGDSLPVAFPNLGPEILAAFYGCPIHFGDYGTSWSDPILKDLAPAQPFSLDLDNPLFSKLEELTGAMLEIGKGKFIVGLSDFHPGGDLLAALRNPQDLALDLVENPEQVKEFLTRLEPDYFRVYDFWYEKLRAAGQPITSWLEMASYGKYYIPSNDFSAMISTKMYREFFLPGIIAECQFLDRSIYHLDGPGALRHLDTILEIPELDAVQWVPGAGREIFSKWIQIYQKIQAAEKGILVYCELRDLELVMTSLSPRGLALAISGVPDAETGLNLLSRLQTWTRNYR